MVMSGKGGVGKSTVAANLAVALAQRDFTVGLLDADLHGPNIPYMLGLEDAQITVDEKAINPVEVSPHLKVMSTAFLLEDSTTAVIWRGPVKMKVIQQFISDVRWGALDYFVIDLPPGTGDEPLSIAQLIPSGQAIIVTTPQDVALLDARKAVTFARRLNLQVAGIIENMSGFTCPKCGTHVDIFKRHGGQQAAAELSVPYLGSLSIDPAVALSGDDGSPFINAGNTPAAHAFGHIVDAIIAQTLP